MKETLKRLCCLLMALIMVFALAACNEPAEENEDEDEETTTETTVPEEIEDTTAEDTQATEETEKEPELETTLVGQWIGEVDLSALMSQFLLELDLDYELEMEECVLVINASFDEDGTTVWEIDEDSVEAIYESFADAMWNMTVQLMAESLGGVSLSAAEEVLVAQGMTKESLMEEMGGVDTDEIETLRGQWRLEGDQLYMIMEESEEDEAEPATIEFGYGTFSIVEIPIEDDEDAELSKAMLPIVFKRVK